MAVLLLLMTLGLPFPVLSSAQPPTSAAIESSLDYLLPLSTLENRTAVLDGEKIDPVLAFVGQAAEMAEYVPEAHSNIQGASITFTIERSLQDVLRYAYNRHIPEGAVNPSSVNHSRWKFVQGGEREVPDVWRYVANSDFSKVFKGVMSEAITPDLHTETYYEYDLQRTIMLFEQGSWRGVISLSEQLGHSDVGKKGYIVGSDKDWNYLYSQDQGLNKRGLGWVKSKIYNYFSICIYLENRKTPSKTKVGVFQWLGAGWAGLNMVRTHHIRNGLERYAVQFKGLLESDQMPSPESLEEISAGLQYMDLSILKDKVYAVTRHVYEKAQGDPALRKKEFIKEFEDHAYVEAMDRSQLVSVLMREYVKLSLGKETPLRPSFFIALRSAPAVVRPPV